MHEILSLNVGMPKEIQDGKRRVRTGIFKEPVTEPLLLSATQVEVTKPRVPCFKLALRMEESAFLKPFMAQARVGFYLRVLEKGEVGAGDSVERVQTGPERMTVREMFNLLYNDEEKLEGARKALCIPALSPGWRGAFEKIVTASGVDPTRDLDCCSGG